ENGERTSRLGAVQEGAPAGIENHGDGSPGCDIRCVRRSRRALLGTFRGAIHRAGRTEEVLPRRLPEGWRRDFSAHPTLRGSSCSAGCWEYRADAGSRIAMDGGSMMAIFSIRRAPDGEDHVSCKQGVNSATAM